MRKPEYRVIPEAEVPSSLRFDVPGQRQGQIVEYAYADWPVPKHESCEGAQYMRRTDRSDRSITFYKLSPTK